MKSTTKAVLSVSALMLGSIWFFRPFATVDRHYLCEGKRKYISVVGTNESTNAILGLRLKRYSNIGDSPYYVNYKLIYDKNELLSAFGNMYTHDENSKSFVDFDNERTIIEKWEPSQNKKIGYVFVFDSLTGTVNYVHRFKNDNEINVETFNGKCKQTDGEL